MNSDHFHARGYDSFEAVAAQTTASTAASDFSASCAAEVAAGMCLCKPLAGGTRTPGAPATTRGGAPWCKTLPDIITFFASDGGLGTTRVSLSPSGRGS